MCYGIVLSPVSPPELSLDEPQGVTQDQVKELVDEVCKLAKERVGEVGGVSGWGQELGKIKL